MSRKLDVVTMTGDEYDALIDEIDELRKRLVQKMNDCVQAEQLQKKDAETYWTAREMLVSRIERLHETLRGIAAADWKEWQELASAEEFVRWAKARALHTLTECASVEGNNARHKPRAEGTSA